MDKTNKNIIIYTSRMRVFVSCLIFLLAGTLLFPAQAGMKNTDTGETCQGIDCEGFSDPPDTGSGSSGSSMGLDEVIDCDDTQSKDIRAVAWNIADDWTNFDNQIETVTSFNLGNCTQDRFSTNGKVKCMAKNKCKNNGTCRNGSSSPFNKKIKIYPAFLNTIAGLPQPDRRACYAALMTHEFAHSCDRMEGRAEAREDASFNYWKDRFAVTSNLDLQNDCGMD